MKRTALYIILFLAMPAFCQASYGPDVLHGLHGSTVSSTVSYHLVLESGWAADLTIPKVNDLVPDVHRASETGISLRNVHSGIACPSREAPGDMASMMSFLWAEMFGGVDVVAELKEFARDVKNRGRYVKVQGNRMRDTRRRWKFTVSYRIDNQTEVAALYENRGRLFGDGGVGLQISTLDPVSEEVGLKMAYSDGELDIRADRISLTERAEAKIVVKF